MGEVDVPTLVLRGSRDPVAVLPQGQLQLAGFCR